MFKIALTPHFFSISNLLFGLCIIFLSFQTNVQIYIFICLLMSVICDFFDGYFARLLNSESTLGKYLDTLADAVSFGIATSCLIFFHFYSVFGFILSLSLCVLYFGACLQRLLRYLRSPKSAYFRGLPTPVSSLIIFLSLSLFSENTSFSFAILLCLIVLLNVNVQYFHIKNKKYIKPFLITICIGVPVLLYSLKLGKIILNLHTTLYSIMWCILIVYVCSPFVLTIWRKYEKH